MRDKLSFDQIQYMKAYKFHLSNQQSKQNYNYRSERMTFGDPNKNMKFDIIFF